MAEEMTILTAKETADYLRVSFHILRRMEKERTLVSFRTPGGHRRYSLREVNQYLNNSRGKDREVDPDWLDTRLTLYTAKEAARYLRVSMFTLSKIEREGGLIPFRLPGKARRYSLRMLNAYLKGSLRHERGFRGQVGAT